MGHDALKKIAILESKNDQLETELSYLNKLLVKVGFEDGIETLKVAAHELIIEESVKAES